MISPYLLFLIGFIILIKGADILIDGASSFARRLKVTSWIIGITIVGIGTSIPELTVTVFSATGGNFNIGLGTIIGSNTFNLLFILGLSSIIMPIIMKKDWIFNGLPPNILAVLISLIVLTQPIAGSQSFYGITKPEGAILTVFFLAWLGYVSLRKRPDEGTDSKRPHKLIVASAMSILGLAGVIIGGEWVIEGSVEIAKIFGVSQSLIGLTIVGIGTSIPELAVSGMAAYRKQFGIAVGNIVGSNIFDFLAILGVSALFTPIPFSSHLTFDIHITLFSAILLFIVMIIGRRFTLTRMEGIFFMLLYLAYLAFIIQRG